MHVFDVTIKSFDNMLDSHPRNHIPEFFVRLAPSAKGIKKWYAAKARTWEDTDTATEVASQPGVEEDELDLEFLGQFLDLDDNLWLQNLLSADENQAPNPML